MVKENKYKVPETRGWGMYSQVKKATAVLENKTEQAS